MKYILLLLISITTNSHSLEFELNSSFLRINQNLFGTIEFPMDALGVGATIWNDNGVGMKLFTAKSNSTKNKLDVPGKKYTNKIDELLSSSLLYKYDISYFSVIFGVGYTTYKTTWHVNGVKPTGWTNDTDSGLSYGLSIRYTLDNYSAVEFGYNDYYRKNKPNFGKEKTTGYEFNYIYRF